LKREKFGGGPAVMWRLSGGAVAQLEPLLYQIVLMFSLVDH